MIELNKPWDTIKQNLMMQYVSHHYRREAQIIVHT